MRLKSTIYKWSALLLLNQCFLAELKAAPHVYCEPIFLNGCNLWNNQTILLDSINWQLGITDCTVFDYTSISTTLDRGVSYPMTVTNGGWCGVGVWVDFNNDQGFDSTENLYHNYGNLTSNYTYNFNIMIPGSVNSGSYRMRVLAGWGTDCYTPSANGNGPCGDYQYGNFEDFTLNVSSSPVGVEKISNNISAIEAFPNPAVSSVTVSIKDYNGNESLLQLIDITGNVVRSVPVKNKKEVIDMNDLSKGVYILRYADGVNSRCLRVVK